MFQNTNHSFLEFVEKCLQKNPSLDVKDVLKDVVKDHSEIFDEIGIKHQSFEELKEHEKIQNHEKWNKKFDKVLYNHFDAIHGQCVTIDISPLYEDGKIHHNTMVENVYLFMHLNENSSQNQYMAYLHNVGM